MKINPFEGARRLAILAAICWALGATMLFWQQEIYVPITYIISNPGDKAIRASAIDCNADDASEYTSETTSEGVRASVTLCFTHFRNPDGSVLIPFRKSADGTVWGDLKYSQSVTAYTRLAKTSFEIPAIDEKWVAERVWPARWNKIKEASTAIFGGVFAVWVFTLVAGWIVRGFFGIPAGQDSKPPS